MNTYQNFDHSFLDNAGLNRHAVFDLDALPPDLAAAVVANCQSIDTYRQLILIAHAGQTLWDCVKAAGIASDDPIDDFTTRTVQQWFAQDLRQHQYEILYPGGGLIGLQRLGKLAGWHHPTPFKVGIDQEWGTWFAYRAVVLADTQFEPTTPLESDSPCDRCSAKPCIANCPAGALDGGQLDMEKCIAYRKQPQSLCKATCLARVSCPVGTIHRYSDEQIHHVYSRSMKAIELYY